MEINSAFLSSQSQLITITESWIQTNENNDFLIKECLPENYILLSFPREFSTGGGILLIHRKDIFYFCYSKSMQPRLRNCYLLSTFLELSHIFYLLLWSTFRKLATLS